MNLQSAKLGLCFGMMLPAQGVGSREPVAWLYNGVRLPDIYKVYTPELQKTHPFAVIEQSRWGTELYNLHILSSAPYMNGNFIYLPGERLYCSSNCGAEWGEVYSGTEISCEGRYVKWSNTDILNADGSVFLAASDPVPVYE